MSVTHTKTHDVRAGPKNDSRGGHMFYLKPNKLPLETRREVASRLEDSGVFAKDYPHEKVAEVVIESTVQGQDRSKPFRTSEILELTINV
ncbi:hypothetical protein HJTV-1_gp108 [Haloarcula virus HJTV-1]|nr:hypothetical protein HRTV-9_gp100 [Halorubrum virus HRTV-9]UBF21231.1 hypothetical protein HJTV-1_gp108 [Haloarcula virus HJTV-1]